MKSPNSEGSSAVQMIIVEEEFSQAIYPPTPAATRRSAWFRGALRWSPCHHWYGHHRPRLGYGARGRVAASLQRRPVGVLRGHEDLLPGLYVLRATDEQLSATMSLSPGSDPEPKETIMGVLVFDKHRPRRPDSLPARPFGKYGLVRLARTQGASRTISTGLPNSTANFQPCYSLARR